MLKLLAGAALVGASLIAAPLSLAEPDPHIPDANAGWCPAGNFHERMSGGGTYCLGVEFPDRTFYAQQLFSTTNPFGPGKWSQSASCSHWGDSGTVQGASGNGSCGGGPDSINR